MKIFEGTIVSVGMNKTIVVEVVRRTPHPLYKKLLKRSKNYNVDPGDFEVEVGNKVKITETRPISKNKYFKISEVLTSSGKTKVKGVENSKPIKRITKKTAKKLKAVKTASAKASAAKGRKK